MRPLVTLLRSDAPLSNETRQFMASELDRAPKQRFLGRDRKDPAIRQRDRLVLEHLDLAKWALADGHAPEIHPHEIKDAQAYEWLAERGFDWVTPESVNNARRRAKDEGRTWIECASGKP